MPKDAGDTRPARRKMLDTEDAWQRTFDALPDLISIHDTEHRILRVNKAMADKLGLTPEQAEGEFCFVHVHGTDAPPEFCPHCRLLEDAKEHVSELHEERLGGDFIVSVTPIFDPEGKVLGSVHLARDITEQKRMAERLARQNEELKEAARMKADFVNMAVHDFASPLTVIRGYVDLLKEGTFGNVTQEQRDVLDRVARAEEVLAELRADMLAASGFEQGKIALERAPVPLREVVSSCIEELESLARGKGQEIAVDVPDVTVTCDRLRVRQVLRNLLSNAIRYTGTGGRIEIAARPVDDGVLVSVKDNGRGIAKDDLEKIFTGFYRSGEKVEGSTGMGLVVVRAIVEAHGGRAWCESELGSGSTFFFTLPAGQ